MCYAVLSILLESYQDVTDYNSVLIKQLGIGSKVPSIRDKYKEPSEEDIANIDVYAGSLLVPQSLLEPSILEPSNCSSLSQSTMSSLKDLPTEKNNYCLQMALPMSTRLSQLGEWTVRNPLLTIMEQTGKWLDKICQVSYSMLKCSCDHFRISCMLRYFSVCNFMPLEYPT